jgi:hypothetical protein
LHLVLGRQPYEYERASSPESAKGLVKRPSRCRSGDHRIRSPQLSDEGNGVLLARVHYEIRPELLGDLQFVVEEIDR